MFGTASDLEKYFSLLTAVKIMVVRLITRWVITSTNKWLTNNQLDYLKLVIIIQSNYNGQPLVSYYWKFVIEYWYMYAADKITQSVTHLEYAKPWLKKFCFESRRNKIRPILD